MPGLLAAVAALTAAAPNAGRPPHLALSLIATTEQPRPGSSMTLGLRFRPEPGWHGYWSNPGDSGLAPTVVWQAPTGVAFGPLAHPAPTLLAVAGMTSFVHAGEHVLLTRATIPGSLAPGTALPISADVRWLACSARLCVPEHANVRLDLKVGDGGAGSDAAAIATAQAIMPRMTSAASSYSVADGEVRLVPPPGFAWDPAHLRFYPDDNGVIEVGRMKAVREGRTIVILAPLIGKFAGRLSGVMSDGQHALRLTFAPQARAAEEKSGVDAPELGKAAEPATKSPRTMDAVKDMESGRSTGSVPALARQSAPSSALTKRWSAAAAFLIVCLAVVAATFGWARRRRGIRRPTI